jgi:hypothetical protein
MKINRYISFPAAGVLVLLAAVASFAQKSPAEKPSPSTDAKRAVSAPASAAYAELLLKRTELQSDLESFILEYTEEYPKVKEIRFVLGLYDREIARLARVKATDSEKLTVALGKLMVRRVELETDLWKLQQAYKDEHPDVKRAKRRVDIYEEAIVAMIS